MLLVELIPAGNRVQRKYITTDHNKPGLRFVILGSDKLEWFEGVKTFGAQASKTNIHSIKIITHKMLQGDAKQAAAPLHHMPHRHPAYGMINRRCFLEFRVTSTSAHV